MAHVVQAVLFRPMPHFNLKLNWLPLPENNWSFLAATHFK
jgi:hypothetical protein